MTARERQTPATGERPRRTWRLIPPRSAAALVLGAIVGLVAIALGTWVVVAQAPASGRSAASTPTVALATPLAPALQQFYPPSPPGYPAVVGWINGRVVPRQQLVAEEAWLRFAAHAPASTPLSAYQSGAEKLIEDHYLLQDEVARRGIRVSPAQAEAAMEDVAKDLAAHPASAPAGLAWPEMLQLQGFSSWSQWLASPRVLAFYQESLAEAQLVRSLVAGLPPAQRNDPRLQQQARERLLATLRAQESIVWAVH